jgi:hypothetical protein
MRVRIGSCYRDYNHYYDWYNDHCWKIMIVYVIIAVILLLMHWYVSLLMWAAVYLFHVLLSIQAKSLVEYKEKSDKLRKKTYIPSHLENDKEFNQYMNEFVKYWKPNDGKW